MDIEGWNGTDTSSLYMSGSVLASVLNQEIACTMTWKNGIAHYVYTKPTVTTDDLEIDPSYFNFNSLTDDMIVSSAMNENQISFTVRGDDLTQAGVAVVNNLLPGVGNLSYDDATVNVTVNEQSGKIDTLAMIFHASMTYQGYNGEADYEIHYAFSENVSQIKNDPIDLLDGYWENNIQSHTAYQFLKNGTVNEYVLEPLADVVPKNLHYCRTLRYQWDGKTLVIEGEDFKTVLEPITTASSVECDIGLKEQLSKIPDGEVFFYETSWNGFANAMYLVKSKSEKTFIEKKEIAMDSNYRSAQGIWLEFLSSGEYKDLTTEWAELWDVEAYGNVPYPTEYAIFDIDGDKWEELILYRRQNGGLSFGYHFVFSCNKSTGEINIVPIETRLEEGTNSDAGHDDRIAQNCKGVAYSPSYHALVYTELNNGMVYNDYGYWFLEDGRLVPRLSIVRDGYSNPEIYYMIQDGNSWEISEAEYSNYIVDRETIDFLPISDIETASDKMEKSDAVEFNGHYYRLYDEGLTWQEAKEACERVGGHLVTITGQKEQEFISGYVHGADKRSYWIGLSDEAKDDKWEWVTDEPFSYSNWAQNEPNHGYGGSEHYVAIVSYDTVYDYDVLLGQWNDHLNDDKEDLDKFGYICEWNDSVTLPDE